MPQSANYVAKGIRRKPGRPGFEAYVKCAEKQVSRYFPAGTSLDVIAEWRKRTAANLHEPAPSLPSLLPPSKPERGGYIYFIVGSEYVKIGKAKDVAQRLKELQTAHAEPLQLVAFFYHAMPSKVEAELHREFGDSRARGEWFRLTRDIIRLMERHAKACELLIPNTGTPLESTT
jgi:hypothetical protein